MDEQTENKIVEKLGKMEGTLDIVKNAVLGNGQPGLSQKVEDLQKDRNILYGGGGLLMALSSILEYFHHFYKK